MPLSSEAERVRNWGLSKRRYAKNKPILLKAAFDRSLARDAGGSVRYIVADVEAAPHEEGKRNAAERPPLNLALVIDASGSMAGKKLENAKRAAIGVVEALSERDRLTVVSFASQGDVLVHLDAVRVDTEIRSQAEAEISRIVTRGMTDLHGGWFRGAECLLRATASDGGGLSRVIVLSDGMANQGVTQPPHLARHAAELREQGVSTSTVGIGDDYHAPVLQALAEHGGGQMHDAELPEEIVEVVLGELGEIFDLVLENVTLSVLLPETLRAELVGFFPVKAASDRMEIFMGSMLGGRRRQAVIRLTLPSARAGDVFRFHLTAAANIPGDGERVETDPQILTLRVVGDSENAAQERDLDRSLAVARAWHAVLVRQSARENRRGGGARVRHVVERELHFFRRYCAGIPGTEELVREIELILRNAEDDWGERTRKEMELRSFKGQYRSDDYRSNPKAPWSSKLGR